MSLSKEAALEVAWVIAERNHQKSSVRSHIDELDRMNDYQLQFPFNALLRFANERADLSEVERTGVKKALRYLVAKAR